MGYANRFSVQAGDTIRFMVSCEATSFDARLVRLRVTMPDVSGSLAKVAALIAEGGGNIVEIQHQRIFGTASVRSPEVEFLIETRDREHTGSLVALLQKNGIEASLS